MAIEKVLSRFRKMSEIRKSSQRIESYGKNQTEVQNTDIGEKDPGRSYCRKWWTPTADHSKTGKLTTFKNKKLSNILSNWCFQTSMFSNINLII